MSKNIVHRLVQDLLRVQKELERYPTKNEYLERGKYGAIIARYFGSWPTFLAAAKRQSQENAKEEVRTPKILVLDIETAPSLAYVWGIRDQDIGINQIVKDRHLLSFSAIWMSDEDGAIMYQDQREEKNIENDYALLTALWELLDAADVVVGQNSKNFDIKVINSRFAILGMEPPSPYKQIDTMQMAIRNFAFTSNRLEYLSDRLCTKSKKDKHKKFPGFELWLECLRGNQEAWEEMKHYNCQDVLATRELYKKLLPWGQQPGVNLNVFHGDAISRCQCGSRDIIRRGYSYTKSGKFQRFYCNSCGSWMNTSGAGNNLFTEKKKQALKNGV